jgi:signal transduction histidine kinase
MNEVAVTVATVVPALSLAASGVALLATRSRPAGALMVVSAVGVIGSALVRLGGADSVAQLLLVGSLLLPAAAALLAYPRLTFHGAVDFCLWITVAAAGVIGTALALDPGISGTLASITALALIGHGWWVLETGADEDREAMLWLALAAVTVGVVFSLLVLEFRAPGAVAGAFLLVAVGPVMVVGVRRPGLADVRSLVVKTVVFAIVALLYISMFIAALALLELAGDADPSPGVVAFVGVLLAVGVHPLRVVLRGLIDELLFGDRPDPLVAATRVADRIGDDPVLALRAIREALVLPYASISADGQVLATSGTSVTDTRRFPLSLGSDDMGELVVGLRPGDLTLSTGDEQVLRIVAPLLAQTLRARLLTNDLIASRAAAITAIEEERRRLRRDLHDGLGPTFSGIAFTADAARNTIASDPATADALLLRLRADAVAAVSEIRRLVYDMRPPALDELGLVPALRQQVASLQTAQGQPMHVQVEAHDLPALPAAVETAAFRIATEAATNSARHSGTDQAWVQIEHRDGCLEVSVRDAGCTADSWVPGVGLSSMRERAAEVGGKIQVTTNQEGSLVRALLPLP